MNDWTRDRNCVTMDDSAHIQKLKQMIAKKKEQQGKPVDQTPPAGHEGEQIDFKKFL